MFISIHKFMDNHSVLDAASGDFDQVPEGKCRIEISRTKDINMVPEDDVEMVVNSNSDRCG